MDCNIDRKTSKSGFSILRVFRDLNISLLLSEKKRRLRRTRAVSMTSAYFALLGRPVNKEQKERNPGKVFRDSSARDRDNRDSGRRQGRDNYKPRNKPEDGAADSKE